jgi:hypothetical protein
MKKIILLLPLLVSCTGTNSKEIPEFDWMPNSLQWEHNIRNCRSQPQCNPADLFNRTGYINSIG